MRYPERVLSALLMAGVVTSVGAQGVRRPDESDVRIYSRLLAMADARSLDTALVDAALASRWQPLRAAATLAIGQIGTEIGARGTGRLRRLLGDRDPVVSANAAYALGLLRDSAAVPDLVAAVARPSTVGSEAAWALGEIGSPARSSIATLLTQPHNTGVSVQLLLAAAKMRPLPLGEIRPFLKNAELPIVWAAAYAIARTRAAAGARDLLDLAQSALVRAPRPSRGPAPSAATAYTDSSIGAEVLRAEIARGIARSAAGDSLGERALAVLARLAGDPDAHVRINAVRSLGTYREAAHALVSRAIRDRDPNVRVAAAQSLATTMSPASTEFASLWAADTSIAFRSALLASAARAGLRPVQLQDWGTSADWHLRAAVASAAGDSLDRAFAISRAGRFIRDPDPRVREAAYAALPPTASMPLEDSVHRLLVAGLRDPDFYVRATVLGALAERPAAGDLPAVLASYDLAARDSANDARLGAVQYVVAVWNKDSSSISPELRSRLRALPIPGDPLERAAGKSIPLFSHWGGVSAAPRPQAWYDSLIRAMVLPVYEGRSITATINTVRGPIRLELFGADAPMTVWNFLSLARSGYYRNTRFHRVVPNFVAQDGDPRDDGNGGPGYAIRDEMNRHRYERGAVGMALSGPDTGGSQYFITHSPQPHLDGHYTVFGRVIDGFNVLDRLVQGDMISSISAR